MMAMDVEIFGHCLGNDGTAQAQYDISNRNVFN